MLSYRFAGKCHTPVSSKREAAEAVVSLYILAEEKSKEGYKRLFSDWLSSISSCEVKVDALVHSHSVKRKAASETRAAIALHKGDSTFPLEYGIDRQNLLKLLLDFWPLLRGHWTHMQVIVLRRNEPMALDYGFLSGRLRAVYLIMCCFLFSYCRTFFTWYVI